MVTMAGFFVSIPSKAWSSAMEEWEPRVAPFFSRPLRLRLFGDAIPFNDNRFGGFVVVRQRSADFQQSHPCVNNSYQLLPHRSVLFPDEVHSIIQVQSTALEIGQTMRRDVQ